MQILPSRWLFVLLLEGGCLMPFAVPPSRLEPAMTALSREGDLDPAFHLTAGAHLASSALPPELPLDVGAGYLLTVGPEYLVQGAYAEASYFFFYRVREPGISGLRSSLGGRAELLVGPGGLQEPGIGLTARLALETYYLYRGPFEGDSSDGFIIGVASGLIAAGGFLEVGYQQLTEGESAVLFSTGATTRLPAALGLLFGIP